MSTLGYPTRLELYVAGEWRGCEGRDSSSVVNPATQKELGRLPVANAGDIEQALHAAADAFPAWSQKGAWQRAAILEKAARLLEERREAISTMLTLENGKPLADSRVELDRVLDCIRYCGEEAKRAYGRVLPPRAPLLVQASVKRAIGPVAAFSPWNFPIFLAVRKVAAALAAGCTIVIKPAEETPASCIELVRAFVDAGVPSGVLNLLYGVPADISAHLIASPVIRKVTFTGSVPVGRQLAVQAAQHLKAATMELGGHAPVLVFDDADVEKAAKACVAFKYRNAGQVCISPSRFFVQAGIAAAFTRRFVQLAQDLRVGDGLQPGVQMGPLNNVRRVNAAKHLVEEAHGNGARVETGGKRMQRDGFFFEPTVLTGLAEDALILRDEPFCPVAPIITFESLDEAIVRANTTEFGLAAYAFTNRLDRAAEFSERIEAAWIGVNNFTPALNEAPVGGMKNSGQGYEGGPEGLDAYMHTRFISQANVLE